MILEFFGLWLFKLFDFFVVVKCNGEEVIIYRVQSFNVLDFKEDYSDEDVVIVVDVLDNMEDVFSESEIDEVGY